SSRGGESSSEVSSTGGSPVEEGETSTGGQGEGPNVGSTRGGESTDEGDSEGSATEDTGGTQGSSSSGTPVDPLPPRERAVALVAELSLAEKIGQMTLLAVETLGGDVGIVSSQCVGGILGGGNSSQDPNT